MRALTVSIELWSYSMLGIALLSTLLTEADAAKERA